MTDGRRADNCRLECFLTIRRLFVTNIRRLTPILLVLFASSLVPAQDGLPEQHRGKAGSTNGLNIAFFSVLDHGAVGDGKSKDTQAIQSTIDACAVRGGGTVCFPAGVYLSGSLHLKKHVTIHLENGATLLASPNDADFDPCEKLTFRNDSDEETSYFHFSLIWAEGVSNIGITGLGTIDSNRKGRGGPKTIALKGCRRVTIRDITIRNAGNYCISLLGTDHVNIDGISVFRSFCDGIDPDCCHHVNISNCHIESWDDAIVPKTSFSLGYERSTEHLTVANCVMATNSNGFKLGTESKGDFRHITVSNCVVMPYTSKTNYRTPGGKPISGIALISADGARIENISITNISMKEVRFPIFMQLSNRGRNSDIPVPGAIRNIIISNVTARHAKIACIVDGLPEHPLHDIHLDNIKINCLGGGTRVANEREVSEMVGKYPSANRYEDVATCGLFIRHVTGLKLEDVELSMDNVDFRHVVICDDVQDLMIDSLNAPGAADGASLIRFDDVRNAMIRGCRPDDRVNVFLNVSGKHSDAIHLTSNDFTNVEEVSVLDETVPAERVRSEFNLE